MSIKQRGLYRTFKMKSLLYFVTAIVLATALNTYPIHKIEKPPYLADPQFELIYERFSRGWPFDIFARYEDGYFKHIGNTSEGRRKLYYLYYSSKLNFLGILLNTAIAISPVLFIAAVQFVRSRLNQLIAKDVLNVHD